VVVTVNRNTQKLFLGPHLEYLEDKDRTWTIEEVSAGALSERFATSPSETPNFGFTRSAYWFRFALQGRHDEPRRWLLELAHPLLDRLELYIQQPSGGFKKQITGDLYPFSQRTFQHRNFVFEVDLLPERTQVFYLRIESLCAIQAPLTLWSLEAFHDRVQNRQLVLGLFYGLLLIMILYNLFLFSAVRDIS
jgi:hypothetical protein